MKLLILPGTPLAVSPLCLGGNALAYLLSRPFPVVPIIGSRKITQLEDGIAALPVRLTPA
jgi:predicted oxidoreductase